MPPSQRLSGVRRTIVPDTVGKRRRDGFHESVRLAQLRAGDSHARVELREGQEHRERPGIRLGVGVADDDELAGRLGDPAVCVRGEARRLVVSDQPCSLRHRQLQAEVRDDHELVHLRLQRREAALQLRDGLVDDDDSRDAHSRLR